MKGLRIIFGFMLMGLLLGLSLPVSGRVPGNQENAVAPKTPQGDTVRMIFSKFYASFGFYGEEGATYKVEWGDGKTDTYTGQGPNTLVECEHFYSSEGICKVLLFGIGTVEKK